MSLDADILHFVNRDLASPWLDPVFVTISILGSVFPFILAAVLPYRIGRRWEALAFVVAVILCELATWGLKDVIARPRPDDVRTIVAASGYSMPSGHAARTMAGAVALWGLGRGWRWTFGGFAALTLVGRMYLGVHFPSDVIAGAWVGIAIGLVTRAGLQAAQFEQALPPEEREPAVRRLWRAIVRAFRFVRELDYLYTLRLLGRLSQEQAQRFWRPSTYWGLARFFGPPVMIATAAILYITFLPHYAAITSVCLAGYFLPFGAEIGIPLCISLGMPWFVVVGLVAYIDAWMALFFLFNLDLLYRWRRIGRWIARTQERSLGYVAKHPWIGRIQFLGVTLFVFLPIPHAGILGGILVGRFVGMTKVRVWLSVMLGTVVRVVLFALGSEGISRLIR